MISQFAATDHFGTNEEINQRIDSNQDLRFKF